MTDQLQVIEVLVAETDVIEVRSAPEVVEVLRGAQGDPGPAGPAGGVGPAGPAGADGINTSNQFIPVRATSDFGNGTDGRVPGVSLSGTATAYAWGAGGPLLWSSVNIDLVWMEPTAAETNDVLITVWAGTLTPGIRASFPVRSTRQVIPTTGVTFCYRETRVASAVPVNTTSPLSFCVARYGGDVLDTATGAIGALGVMVSEAA